MLRPGSGTTSNPGTMWFAFSELQTCCSLSLLAAGINYWLRAHFSACFCFLLFSINVGEQPACLAAVDGCELEEQHEHNVQTYFKRLWSFSSLWIWNGEKKPNEPIEQNSGNAEQSQRNTETNTIDSPLQHARSARIVFQTSFHSINMPKASFLMSAQTV